MRRYPGAYREGDSRKQIWTFEFEPGTQHTIQFGYSKQLIVMTQHNSDTEVILLSSFREGCAEGT